MGLSDTSKAVEPLDDDEKLNSNVILINESGLYTLIIRSTKKEATKFRKWVTREVIPTIRKIGSYGKQKIVQHDYVRRCNANWHRTDRGYFSIISEVYTLVIGFLEHRGFLIPEKDLDTDKSFRRI